MNQKTESTASRERAAEGLISAIRAFTEEAPDDKPNGKAEAAIDLLSKLLDPKEWRLLTDRQRALLDGANGAAGALCMALAADTQALREAAESFFGGDFRTPSAAPGGSHPFVDRGVLPGRCWACNGVRGGVNHPEGGRVTKDGAWLKVSPETGRTSWVSDRNEGTVFSRGELAAAILIHGGGAEEADGGEGAALAEIERQNGLPPGWLSQNAQGYARRAEGRSELIGALRKRDAHTAASIRLALVEKDPRATLEEIADQLEGLRLEVKREPAERWGHSSSDLAEVWSVDCDSREDAIAEGRAEYDAGEVFFVQRFEKPAPALYVPSVDNILDQIAGCAADNEGEYVGDWPEVSEAGKAALEALLEGWARKHAPVTFWRGVGTTEQIEPEESQEPESSAAGEEVDHG